MGPNIDKLFLEVAGKPVVVHTWRVFERSPVIQEIVLVVRDGFHEDFERLRLAEGFRKPVRYARGGAERQNSVWNGLEEVSPEARLVAIQDGARPCTTGQVIADCVAAAEDAGASVAAQKVTDTLKEADANGTIVRNVDRSRLWAVQTPQVFRVEVFARNLLVTDDTAACELIGQAVRLVESRSANPKVTTPADLPLIELLLRERAIHAD